MPRFRILNKPTACLPCSLHEKGLAFSEPEGTCANGVLGIGESLGWNEAVDGLPFRPHAQAGSQLERAFKKVGEPRHRFGLWNLLGCRPPEDNIHAWPSAVDHCRVHLRRVVERFKPRVILAFGSVPLKSLTGLSGKKLSLDMLRGYPLWCDEFQVWLVATHHPSYIARGMFNAFPVMCEDIAKAVRWARDGVPQQNFVAVEDATEEHGRLMLEELQDCPDLPLSLDIEDNSLLLKQQKIVAPPELTQINLAVSERSGIVLPPTVGNMHTFRKMCALPNTKIGQNLFLYDIPQLEEQNGFRVNGRIEDVMWRFHFLYPDLPIKKSKKDEDSEASSDEDPSEAASIANLQYISSFADFPFPWKHHRDDRPGFYGVCDVIAPMMAFWWLYERMTSLGIEDGYQSLVVELMPALRNMRMRGIPVNSQILRDLHLTLIKRIGVNEKGEPDGTGLMGSIQGIVPDILRRTTPTQGYKVVPKDVTGMVLRTYHVAAEPAKRCKCFKIRKRSRKDQEGFDFLQHMENDYAAWEDMPDGTRRLRAPDANCEMCAGRGYYAVEAHKVQRWATLLPFNVNSTDQMWDYARFKHYKVPRNAKGEEAMDADVLLKLAKSTGDPLYKTTVEIRRLDKTDGTYAIGWLNHVKSDGCVHPSVGFFSSIQQLGSRGPNSQNVLSESKHPELAPMFRAGIEAPKGRVIYEADYKGFHNMTLGYEANCPVFIRLARLDIHTYFSVQLLKIPGHEKCLTWPDDELLTWLTWQRANAKLPDGSELGRFRNAKAKHALHGYGNGLKGPGLYRRYPDNFQNEREANWVVDMLDDTFKEVAEFHKWMPLAANRGVRITNDGPQLVKLADGTEETNIVITRFGCMRRFHNIKRYDFKRKAVIHGDDWERAMCYPHTNDAHCHIQLAMKRLEDSGASEKFGLINQVHDALVCCPLKTDLDECDHVVRSTMEAPSEVMLMSWQNWEGLTVGVDAKVGPNWAHMKEYKPQ